MSPRSKELSQEMRTQSREALIAAARSLFAERGYFNVRISDIACQAQMSQGNVYWYFPSKEALLQAVLQEGLGALGAVLAQAVDGSAPARQKLDALLEGLLGYARDGSQFTAIVISLMGHGGNALFARLGFDMEQIGLGYTRSVTSVLAQAQAEGLISADEDPLALTMLFFGLFNGLNLTYGQSWLALPVDALKDSVLRLLGVTG